MADQFFAVRVLVLIFQERGMPGVEVVPSGDPIEVFQPHDTAAFDACSGSQLGEQSGVSVGKSSSVLLDACR